jgi:hypothetical protein
MTTPPDPSNPAPATPTKKSKTPIWLAGIIVAIFAVCGIGLAFALSDTTPPAGGTLVDPAADTADDKPAQPRKPAAPNPDASISGVCDMLLFTGPNDQSEFAASVTVTNTGNVGIEVLVTAAFDQLGRDDYELTDTVKVEIGQTKTVNLSEYIDGATIDRHQSGGYDCRIAGELVETFGDVKG